MSDKFSSRNDYPYLRLWGQYMGSYSYYINKERQARRARELGLPQDIIGFDEEGDYSTIGDIESTETRNALANTRDAFYPGLELPWEKELPPPIQAPPDLEAFMDEQKEVLLSMCREENFHGSEWTIKRFEALPETDVLCRKYGFTVLVKLASEEKYLAAYLYHAGRGAWELGAN